MAPRGVFWSLGFFVWSNSGVTGKTITPIVFVAEEK